MLSLVSHIVSQSAPFNAQIYLEQNSEAPWITNALLWWDIRGNTTILATKLEINSIFPPPNICSPEDWIG